MSSAERKDTLVRLRAFVASEDYRALDRELSIQIENTLDVITNTVPQTVGDFFDREQALGALKALRDIKKFIPFRVEAAQELVDEVTVTNE